jgi:hypothetical protein
MRTRKAVNDSEHKVTSAKQTFALPLPATYVCSLQWAIRSHNGLRTQRHRCPEAAGPRNHPEDPLARAKVHVACRGAVPGC